MAQSDEAIDEKVWSNPYWVAEQNGLNPNNVLFYFQQSIFCDPQSDNKALYKQAELNPALHWYLFTRQAFESQLKTIKNGLCQYVVSHDPTQGDTIHDHSGVWVIRKQKRLSETEVIPLANYFVVDINIFMAPKLLDVFQSRMLSTYKGLTDSMRSASKLALFSPGRGHTYELESQSRQAGPSRQARSSREGSLQPDSASQTTGQTSKPTTNMMGADLLADSLSLALRYRDEYMDENPLVGEPGQFVMRKSRTDNTLVKPSQTAKPPTPLPPPIDTNIVNPLTKPAKGSDKSPTTPGGTKKRKKSRMTSTTTPK